MITTSITTPRPRNPLARRVTLLFLATLTIMAGATIAPSLPGIATAFAADDNIELLSRLVLTLPALFVALSAPFIGSLADRIGRRPLLIGTITLYGLAGISGLLLDTLTGLLIGRALLGVSVGGVMTLSTALVGDYFSGSERDRYLGLQQAFTGLGGLVFLSAGGILAEWHWRGPFAVYGFAFLLLPAVILFLNEPVREPGKATLRKLADASAGSSSRSRLAIVALCALAVVNSVAFYLIPSQLPFHLRELGIDSPRYAGLAIGVLTLASALTSLNYSRLRSRLNIIAIFTIGLLVMAAGMILLGSAGTIFIVSISTAILGAGMGVILPNLITSAMAIAVPSTRGRVSGFLTASIFLGQFVSPFVSQPWIESFGFATTFRDAGILLAVVAVIAVVTGVLGKSRRGRQ